MIGKHQRSGFERRPSVPASPWGASAFLVVLTCALFGCGNSGRIRTRPEILWGEPFPSAEVRRKYGLWPDYNVDLPGDPTEGVHHLFIDALRGSKRFLLVEVLGEGHKPPYYKAFAWGFAQGSYLAYVVGEGKPIRFKSLRGTEREAFDSLLRSLPGSDVDGTEEIAPLGPLDASVGVFVWGKVKGRIVQGVRNSPDLEMPQRGDTRPSRYSPWVRRVFDVLDDMGFQMYDPDYKRHRRELGL